VTGLRFFTIYGPWGRPDMSYFLFSKKIIADKLIDVFNQGRHSRDFTYIDDIVESVARASDRVAASNPGWSGDKPDLGTPSAPYRLYNSGNHAPALLMDYIACIEKAVGNTAKKNFLPLQPGDVPATYADVSDLKAAIGFEPNTPTEKGAKRFVRWYREFYRL
jgi:UDP-glucuronate 4-epimerase